MKTLFKTILSSFLILLSVNITAQNAEVLDTFEKVIEHAESNSLYRNNVDWKSLKTSMYTLAKDADSIAQLKPALDFMFKELKDTHGRVFYNNTYLSYYAGERMEHLKDIDWDVYTDIQWGKYPFKASLLEDDIGYINIIGLPTGDNQQMGADIQNALCEVLEKGAKKWIVDLRFNGGGNMFPMVEGLTSIIGDGAVGGTMGITEAESSTWKITDGDFYYDDYSVMLEEKCTVTTLPKIAVLTSIYTVSSGEALAVILKHRPDTKFFGNKTHGKVTATDWKVIDDQVAMSIAVSFYKDREGNVYKDYVDVDEFAMFNPKATIENDEGIRQAINWLNKE